MKHSQVAGDAEKRTSSLYALDVKIKKITVGVNFLYKID